CGIMRAHPDENRENIDEDSSLRKHDAETLPCPFDLVGRSARTEQTPLPRAPNATCDRAFAPSCMQCKTRSGSRLEACDLGPLTLLRILCKNAATRLSACALVTGWSNSTVQ